MHNHILQTLRRLFRQCEIDIDVVCPHIAGTPACFHLAYRNTGCLYAHDGFPFCNQFFHVSFQSSFCCFNSASLNCLTSCVPLSRADIFPCKPGSSRSAPLQNGKSARRSSDAAPKCAHCHPLYWYADTYFSCVFSSQWSGFLSIVKLYVFSLISGLSDNFLNFNMMMLGANSAFTT